jgi:Glycosyl transferase family 2
MYGTIKKYNMIHERGYWLEIDEPNTHTFDKLLCDEIIKSFENIETAIDIGCGDGRYTRNLIDHGINCKGFDGSPLTPKLSGGLCGVKDFSESVDIGTFDLVLSLEVGEHIPPQYEQVFIDNLCKAARKYLCVSWGIVGQPGYGHFNCRNNDYVIAEMQKRGFIFDEKTSMRLRSASTFPWFKNTIMVFYKKESDIKNIFKGFESSLVSVVITSCGRIDLLRRTIDSFNKFNTFPIHEYIIVEDSGNKAVHRELQGLYPQYNLILNPQNIGLVKSIDRSYAEVKTPFVFHCENDWEFTRSGFIEKSLDILLLYRNVMQVWIRALNDTNGHPIDNEIYAAGETTFMLVSTGAGDGAWHGFTWNPGLRRIADYKMIGPYSEISPGSKAGEAEMYVGIKYYKKGFRAAILREGYVYHTGNERKDYSLV